mgnify:CR=1 FL=1
MAKEVYSKELKIFIVDNYCNSNILELISEKFFPISREQYNNLCKRLGVSVQRTQREFLEQHSHLCYDEIKNLYNKKFNTHHSRRDIMKMCHKRGIYSTAVYTKWAVYVDSEPTYVSNYVQGMFHATKHNDETDTTTLKICQLSELCNKIEGD